MFLAVRSNLVGSGKYESNHPWSAENSERSPWKLVNQVCMVCLLLLVLIEGTPTGQPHVHVILCELSCLFLWVLPTKRHAPLLQVVSGRLLRATRDTSHMARCGPPACSRHPSTRRRRWSEDLVQGTGTMPSSPRPSARLEDRRHSYRGWTKSCTTLKTTENHCWLVFTGESSFQGFLGAGFQTWNTSEKMYNQLIPVAVCVCTKFLVEAPLTGFLEAWKGRSEKKREHWLVSF